MPWKVMARARNVSIMAVQCGKSAHVITPVNGNIGVRAATNTTAAMATFMCMWETIATLVTSPDRSFRLAYLLMAGCTVELLCVHRAKRCVVNTLEPAMKSVVSEKRLHP